MTNDSLKARIDKDEFKMSEIIANRNALLAVLEIHKEGKNSDETWCEECGEFRYHYPCPTIQAISNALGEVR